MKNYFILFLFLNISTATIAQKVRWIDIAKSNSDCMSAIEIDIIDTIKTTTSPIGYGNILEFSKNPKKSLKYIEKEHHTVWYQFKIPNTGVLNFELLPFSIADDYDFMLFKYEENSLFCQQLKDKVIEPVRTNISRNDKTIQSKTGLKTSSTAVMIHSGPGAAYSQSLSVQKGEVYYLLIDNVYKNGKGHQLSFDLQYEKEEKITTLDDFELHPAPTFTEKPQTEKPTKKPVAPKVEPPKVESSKEVTPIAFSIKGNVKEETTNEPLQAEINFIDTRTGEIIISILSDSITGDYDLKIPKREGSLYEGLYTLEIQKEGYFFSSQNISAREIPFLKDSKIETTLPLIATGGVYRIQNINFYGNSPKPLPNAIPVLKSLLRIMTENPELKIRIEGHTNGCNSGHRFSKKLSFARAKAVQNYLIFNGIDKNRLEHTGFSCDRMLFPNPQNAKEQMLNRRVEIRVL